MGVLELSAWTQAPSPNFLCSLGSRQLQLSHPFPGSKTEKAENMINPRVPDQPKQKCAATPRGKRGRKSRFYLGDNVLDFKLPLREGKLK